jgi:hypothetical protein
MLFDILIEHIEIYIPPIMFAMEQLGTRSSARPRDFIGGRKSHFNPWRAWHGDNQPANGPPFDPIS